MPRVRELGEGASGHQFLRTGPFISSACAKCGWGIEHHDEWPEYHQDEHGHWWREPPPPESAKNAVTD